MTVIATLGEASTYTGEQPELAERLLDATVALVARWGVVKTTMGDIAREAECSRATAYRLFPGKKALLLAAAHRELARFSLDLGTQLQQAPDLESALVLALTGAHRFVTGHESLQFVLANEPGLVLPFLGFGHIDALYAQVHAYSIPHLARFLDPDQAAWAGEWVCRVLFSYLFHPAPGIDPGTVEGATTIVRSFVLPALTPIPPPDRS